MHSLLNRRLQADTSWWKVVINVTWELVETLNRAKRERVWLFSELITSIFCLQPRSCLLSTPAFLNLGKDLILSKSILISKRVAPGNLFYTFYIQVFSSNVHFAFCYHSFKTLQTRVVIHIPAVGLYNLVILFVWFSFTWMIEMPLLKDCRYLCLNICKLWNINVVTEVWGLFTLTAVLHITYSDGGSGM